MHPARILKRFSRDALARAPPAPLYAAAMTAERALCLAAGASALGGVALRVSGFGRHGFWNDEAWVAIASRVETWSQFRLAVGPTPAAWAALLRPLAVVPAPPEVALRLLPLAAGLATLWLAWRLGGRLAGHAAGGLAALALVALDPTGIAWAQQLKPYTTEAALALLAFLAAAGVARDPRPGAVAWLGVVLALGAPLSHAQLLIAPPLVVALAARAVLRRDRPGLRRLLLVGAVVGLGQLTWFTLVVHPAATPALRDYWNGHYVPPDPIAAHRFVAGAIGRLLAPSLGAWGPWLAAGGLAVLLAWPGARWAALATALLWAELVALSALRLFPLDVPRVLLFATTLLLVTTGAGAGRLLAGLGARPALRPAALGLAAAFAAAVAHGHGGLGSAQVMPEDLGPLLRRVEAERRAGDRVLLYEPSLFVWGFYRIGPPVLVPAPQLPNGFLVVGDDPDLVTVRGPDVDAAVARAFTGAGRVWFVGSRFRGTDEQRLRAAVGRHGHVLHEERRPRALLLLLEPR